MPGTWYCSAAAALTAPDVDMRLMRKAARHDRGICPPISESRVRNKRRGAGRDGTGTLQVPGSARQCFTLSFHISILVSADLHFLLHSHTLTLDIPPSNPLLYGDPPRFECSPVALPLHYRTASRPMCRQRHSWSRQSGGAVLRTGPPRSACPGTDGAEYASIGRPWKMPTPGRGEPVGQEPSVSVRRYSTRGTGERQKGMPCHMLTGNCDSACGYAAFGTAWEP